MRVWILVGLLFVAACGDRRQQEAAALKRLDPGAEMSVRLNPATAGKVYGLTFEGLAGPRFKIADASATESSQLIWSLTEVLPRTHYEFVLDVEKAQASAASALRIEMLGGGERTVFDCGFDAKTGIAAQGEAQKEEQIVDQGEFWRITCPAVSGTATDTINVTLWPAAQAPEDQGEIVFRRVAFARKPL